MDIYENKITGVLDDVGIITREKNGIRSKRCRIVLSRTFDKSIASMLGSDAQHALDGVKSGGLKSAILPLDAVQASGQFKATDNGAALKVGRMRGMSAAVRPGTKDEDPRITMAFAIEWDAEAWAFFGGQSGSEIEMKLKARQTSFEFDVEAQADGDSAGDDAGDDDTAADGVDPVAGAVAATSKKRSHKSKAKRK